MKDVPPGKAAGHHLRRADEGRGLPVALGPEPVPVGHQALDGEAGKLGEAVEVLERRGEGGEAALPQEGPHPGLDPGLLAQVGLLRVARPDLVGLAVLREERVHLGVRHLVDHRDEVADPVAVDRVAELPLRRHLVALGDRHLAHVVAEAGHLEPARLRPAAGRAHPRADPVVHLLVLPVADHDLAGQAQPRADEPELAVAVGGLVQVHEVHVDRAPRQVAVELRVEVQEGLLERGEAGDPHLRGREGVHPEDEADAALRHVGLGEEGGDLVRRLHDGLEDDPAGDAGGLVERGRDRPRVRPRPASASPARRGAGCR